MSKSNPQQGPYDIVVVAQSGRLTYEVVLFAASLRHHAPDFAGRLIIAEPRPGPLWPGDPRMDDDAARDLLIELGADFLPFECNHFGAAYPNGNKIEALAALPANRPFVFFDSDTLITGPIDQTPFNFDRPSASMAREDTWPNPPLYGPGHDAIWRAIYDRSGVEFEPTLDLSEPLDHWQRYLYFNAGWFYYKCPQTFAAAMIRVMTDIRDNPIPELASQKLYPWLDQIALPIVVAELGGGRPDAALSGLDGAFSQHWRVMSLFFAKSSDETLEKLMEVARPNKIKKVLKSHEPFKRMIFQNKGNRVRALFDQSALPIGEKVIRNRIKREGLWMR
ncbi:hypothetical protein N9L47_07720 [Rhodobacteraceae bacterium]|nr:hypothetical protein [Paracoccaceae bacterium]